MHVLALTPCPSPHAHLGVFGPAFARAFQAGGAEAARGTVEAWLTAGGVDPHKHAANGLDDGADWLRSSWRRLTSDRRANAAGLTKS